MKVSNHDTINNQTVPPIRESHLGSAQIRKLQNTSKTSNTLFGFKYRVRIKRNSNPTRSTHCSIGDEKRQTTSNTKKTTNRKESFRQRVTTKHLGGLKRAESLKAKKETLAFNLETPDAQTIAARKGRRENR